jgi:hypothetical protein
MQALSDDQHMERIEKGMDRLEGRMDRLETRMDRLETKMEAGFSEVRGEFAPVRGESRSDFRTLLNIQLGTLATMVVGFGGIAAQHFL